MYKHIRLVGMYMYKRIRLVGMYMYKRIRHACSTNCKTIHLCDIRDFLYPDREKHPSYSWIKIRAVLENDGWLADLFAY